MPARFFLDRRPHHGFDYDAYLTLMEDQANTSIDGLAPEDAERVAYTKLNLHRTRRIGRTYEVSPELAARLDAVTEPRLWMVLTEPWCGDSAQCLPYLAAMAGRNPLIELRILLRDANLDIMDRYLTNGSRSIPRLVVLAADGTELWEWGPRPAAAQAEFERAKAEGLDKPELLERLHLWYGRDRGKGIEGELTSLVR